MLVNADNVSLAYERDFFGNVSGKTSGKLFMLVIFVYRLDRQLNNFRRCKHKVNMDFI